MLRVLLIIVGLILIGIMITIIRYTKAEVLINKLQGKGVRAIVILGMLGCMMLFFMAFASVTSGIYSDGAAWRITGYGLPAALLAGMLSLPRMVFTLIDKAAYINENHPLNPVDCLFFCFVLLLCVTAARLPQTAQPQEAPAA